MWWRRRRPGELRRPVCVVGHMGLRYQVVTSDAGDTNKRLVFLFGGRKLDLLDEIGQISSVQPLKVHLYSRLDTRAEVDRRVLEGLTAAWWRALWNRSKNAGTREPVAVGDSNMPMPGRTRVNLRLNEDSRSTRNPSAERLR